MATEVFVALEIHQSLNIQCHCSALVQNKKTDPNVLCRAQRPTFPVPQCGQHREIRPKAMASWSRNAAQLSGNCYPEGNAQI